MKHELKPGHTFESMAAVFRKRVKGKCIEIGDGYDSCSYRILRADGPRYCAVGAFIPEDCAMADECGPVWNSGNSVAHLLMHFPDLEEFMPLGETGLLRMQHIHDYSVREDVAGELIAWMHDECVESTK